jgi:hypothetical protein
VQQPNSELSSTAQLADSLQVLSYLAATHSLGHLFPNPGPLDTARKAQNVGHWRKLGRRCQVRVKVEERFDLT